MRVTGQGRPSLRASNRNMSFERRFGNSATTSKDGEHGSSAVWPDCVEGRI